MIAHHNPRINPPEPFKDVLLAVIGEKEMAEGWRTNEEGKYMYSTGHSVPSGLVYAWTELPECPPLADFAIRRVPVLKERAS